MGCHFIFLIVSFETQKLVAFLYTNNKLSERKTKKTVPFTIATTTKSEVPKNKFKQGDKRPIVRKL